MAQYVTGLIRSGKLPEEDVLRFEANLEDSTFPAEEIVQVLAELAASPADDRPAVTLTLPVNDVGTAHEDRFHKTCENPGIAGTLLKLAQDPAYAGPVTISKPDFACAPADRMLAEVSESPDNDEAIEALRRRRPGHLDLTAIISRGITPCDRQPQAVAQIPSPLVPLWTVTGAGGRAWKGLPRGRYEVPARRQAQARLERRR
jgi:hypothetical protein